jgi:hypothetical protein
MRNDHHYHQRQKCDKECSHSRSLLTPQREPESRKRLLDGMLKVHRSSDVAQTSAGTFELKSVSFLTM